MNAIAGDWRSAQLTPVDFALCEYAEKLTLTPKQMSVADIDALRAVGLDDRAIHDGTQVIGFFNYIDRIADALGIENETFVAKWGDLPDRDSHKLL